MQQSTLHPDVNTALTAADKLEIKDLITAYNYYEDIDDAEGWAGLFTIDGSLFGMHTTIGREDLLAFARRRKTNKPAGRNRTHWASNVLIHANENGAVAQSYQMSIDQKNGGFTVAALSIKADELRKEDGHWRFFIRRVLPIGEA